MFCPIAAKATGSHFWAMPTETCGRNVNRCAISQKMSRLEIAAIKKKWRKNHARKTSFRRGTLSKCNQKPDVGGNVYGQVMGTLVELGWREFNTLFS